jgi:drug/metabolite transporter (DMT)-like permease
MRRGDRADQRVTDTAARPRDAATEPASVGLAFVALALASLFWAGNHVLGRAIAGTVPPFAISAIRWTVPALILLPFAIPHLRRDWPAIRANKALIFWLSAIGGGLFGVLQYVGLQYTTAINVSVLNSLSPVMIAVAAALLFGERLSLAQATGVAISLAGVLVIVCRGDPWQLASLGFNWGDLIIIFNMATFGVFSACLRLRPAMHWLSWMFLFALVSALVALPAFALEHLSGRVLPLTAASLAALAYASVFPTLLANLAWNRGVEVVGVNRSGATLHLVAVFSALLSTLLLGEALQSFHFAGFVLILAGVALATRKR